MFDNNTEVGAMKSISEGAKSVRVGIVGKKEAADCENGGHGI